MNDIEKFSTKTITTLKHYVYTYSDPRDGKVFYVGKGTGNRCFAHLGKLDGEWGAKLKSIDEAGLKPTIDILAYGLEEVAAQLVEAAIIETYGKDSLVNRVRGHKVRKRSVADIENANNDEEIDINQLNDNLLRISINNTYWEIDPHSPFELYEITRASWSFARLPKDLMDPEIFPIVLATVSEKNGQRVVEVYKVMQWFKAPDVFHSKGYDQEDRYCFVGNVAEQGMRSTYVNKLLPKNQQGEANPQKTFLGAATKFGFSVLSGFSA